MTRELYALWGERAPPIAITENKFKGRPKWSSKQRAHPWSAVSTSTDHLYLIAVGRDLRLTTRLVLMG